MYYSAKKNTWFDSDFRDKYEKSGAWPDDAIEYSRDVFDAVVTNRPANKYMVPGHDGVPMLLDTILTLDKAKDSAYADIDFHAGETRKKYITDVSGQSETYLLKSEDAKAYKAVGYPSVDIALYPMVRAEARALYGETPTSAQFQSATDFIIDTQSNWLQIAADIEEQRRTGKESVKSAATAADVAIAKDAAIIALQAL